MCTDLEGCKEIVENRPLSPEELAARGATGSDGKPDEEIEPEEILDPDDPLYGLEVRLRSLLINEDTKKVIKIKLQEASLKIKDSLRQRQETLEARLA